MSWTPEGLVHLPGFLSDGDQKILAKRAREVAKVARMMKPLTAGGLAQSVRITSAGDAGWWSDQVGGPRYVTRHPESGKPWPKMPREVRVAAVASLSAACVPICEFDSALFSFYSRSARLGWHTDASELDRTAPIVVLSLGDAAIFRVREYLGREESLVSAEFRLVSGDALVMSGHSRSLEHTVAAIKPADMFNPSPLGGDGRLSITVRKAM